MASVRAPARVAMPTGQPKRWTRPGHPHGPAERPVGPVSAVGGAGTGRGCARRARVTASRPQPEVKASISLFMAYVHTTVNDMSKVYLAMERRYNYTTPKTFLEQIKLYQNLLAKKRAELVAKIERLENGLMKLQSTASQVRGGRGAAGTGRAASPRTARPLW